MRASALSQLNFRVAATSWSDLPRSLCRVTKQARRPGKVALPTRFFSCDKALVPAGGRSPQRSNDGAQQAALFSPDYRGTPAWLSRIVHRPWEGGAHGVAELVRVLARNL